MPDAATIHDPHDAAADMRDDPALADLIAAMAPARSTPGATVFRQGDRADRLYYLRAGRILLEELSLILEPGTVFGEIAFFTEAGRRTVSARCHGPCDLLAIDGDDLMPLLLARPQIAVFLLRLIANRLLDGAATAPEAYLHMIRND